jgi:hypothetical protein
VTYPEPLVAAPEAHRAPVADPGALWHGWEAPPRISEEARRLDDEALCADLLAMPSGRLRELQLEVAGEAAPGSPRLRDQQGRLHPAGPSIPGIPHRSPSILLIPWRDLSLEGQR